MNASPLSMIFSSIGMIYVLFLPLIAVQLFALIAIPTMLRPGLRTLDVGRALISYASQTVGILLMSIGGVPTLYSVLVGLPLTGGTYTALLFIFAIGGITYLWHDAALSRIDPAARAVPRMIFACAWKFIGLLLVLLSLLSLVLHLVLQGSPTIPGWWILHLALIFYGVILTYASIAPAPTSSTGFRSQTMTGTSAVKRKKK